MFSVNNFYDYLRYMYDWPKKTYALRSFRSHGDCNLAHLVENRHPDLPFRFYGFCDLYDQEPVYLDRILTSERRFSQ